jgi:hypothetical protein
MPFFGVRRRTVGPAGPRREGDGSRERKAEFSWAGGLPLRAGKWAMASYGHHRSRTMMITSGAPGSSNQNSLANVCFASLHGQVDVSQADVLEGLSVRWLKSGGCDKFADVQWSRRYNVNRAGLILMATHKLTAEIINAAVEGFEQQKLRIDAQIAELRAMHHVGPTETAAAPELPKGKRRKMSAAARKRIGDAQRKRWAESKKESAPSSPVAPEAAKPKRKLSAAGKKAIAEASRRRWARVRAEAATAAKAKQPPAAKKAVTKKAPVKASRKAAKKVAAKKTAATPAVPAATE